MTRSAKVTGRRGAVEARPVEPPVPTAPARSQRTPAPRCRSNVKKAPRTARKNLVRVGVCPSRGMPVGPRPQIIGNLERLAESDRRRGPQRGARTSEGSGRLGESSTDGGSAGARRGLVFVVLLIWHSPSRWPGTARTWGRTCLSPTAGEGQQRRRNQRKTPKLEVQCEQESTGPAAGPSLTECIGPGLPWQLVCVSDRQPRASPP